MSVIDSHGTTLSRPIVVALSAEQPPLDKKVHRASTGALQHNIPLKFLVLLARLTTLCWFILLPPLSVAPSNMSLSSVETKATKTTNPQHTRRALLTPVTYHAWLRSIAAKI